MSFRLAMIQMEVLGGDFSKNLAIAEALIAEAAKNGADIALLPEALDVGWTDPSSAEMAGEIPGGLAFRKLAESAAKSGIYVCGGLTEKKEGTVYNSAVLIDDSGTLQLKHRKVNELDIAREFYQVGDRLGVVQTRFGSIGLMICADAFVDGQVISRTLGCMGADIILSPCAWAVDADHDNLTDPYGQLWLDSYQPVAREFGLWIAGASNVGLITGGPWKGRKCIGCSMVVGAKGDLVALAPYGETAESILYVDLPAPR